MSINVLLKCHDVETTKALFYGHCRLQDMPYSNREFGIKDYDEYHLAFVQKNNQIMYRTFAKAPLEHL